MALQDILSLELEIAELENDQRALAKTLSARKTKLSELRARGTGSVPISRVPPELLAEIFSKSILRQFPQASVSDTSTYHPRPCRSQGQFPLAHVCRHWREIAFSAPTLWTSLSLHLIGNISHATSTAELWLKNSGQLPIDVFVFDMTGNPTHEQSTQFTRVLEMVVDQMGRWKSFHLYSPNLGCQGGQRAVQFLSDLLRTRISTLKHRPPLEQMVVALMRDLSSPDEPPPSSAVALAGVVSSSPQLRALAWSNDIRPLTSMTLPLLTSLNLRAICGVQCHADGDVLELLRHCPALEELSVFLRASTPGMQDRTRQIILPRLSCLSMSRFGGVPSFLPSLTLPSLETFSVRTDQDGPDFDLVESGEDVLQLFQRSNCSIRSLDLDVIPGSDSLSTILSEKPVQDTLQHLTISAELRESIEEDFEPMFSSSLVLPSLETLRMKMDLTMNGDGLRRLVLRCAEQISKRTSRLQNLTLTLSVFWTQEDMPSHTVAEFVPSRHIMAAISKLEDVGVGVEYEIEAIE